MEPDWNLIGQMFGPAVPILTVIIWIARWYKPIYDRQVAAMERDVILRTYQIKVTKAQCEFLKGQGHDIEIPAFIDSFADKG